MYLQDCFLPVLSARAMIVIAENFTRRITKMFESRDVNALLAPPVSLPHQCPTGCPASLLSVTEAVPCGCSSPGAAPYECSYPEFVCFFPEDAPSGCSFPSTHSAVPLRL